MISNPIEPDYFLSKIAVKLTTKILTINDGAVADIGGSGVIYFTSASSSALYVFTALHCVLGKRTKVEGKNNYRYLLSDVDSVIVEHNENHDSTIFRKQVVKQIDIIVDHNNDFCILKVDKKVVGNQDKFPEILIHSVGRKGGSFRSSGFPNASRERFFPNTYTLQSVSADGIITLQSTGDIHSEDAHDLIGGYSGSGVFMAKAHILVGFMTSLNDETALANNISARDLSKIDINRLIHDHDPSLEAVEYTNDARKIISEEDRPIIDLSRVEIHGVNLNIWKAVGNLQKDISDDWFQDPLFFKDILHSKSGYYLIMNHLTDGNYFADESEVFSVPKEGFTTRRAVQTSFADRVVYQAAVDFIAERLDNKIVSNNVYSARYNYDKQSNNKYFFYNSVEQWRKFQHQIANRLTDERPFLVVTDITNFFDNIPLKILLEKLVDFVSHLSDQKQSTQAVKLVENLLGSWHPDLGYAINGIPQNREASSFLANIFLTEVDKTMIRDFPDYYRFMDDIRILCKDKYQARKALMKLIELVAEIGLNLNSQKTQILDKRIPDDMGSIMNYFPSVDKEIEQINSLIESGKAREIQIAVEMVNEMFHNSLQQEHDKHSRKKFIFTIERLQRFARTTLLRDLINFTDIVNAIINRFEDRPWYTDTYIRFLLTVDSDYITKKLQDVVIPLIVNNDRNVYPWQAYNIFRLLGYHKIDNIELKSYAESLLSQDNGVHRAPEVAGACLYLFSVDPSSVEIIKKSFNKGYFKTFMSQRCAIICLQKIDPIKLVDKYFNTDLKQVHLKAYQRFKDTGDTSDIISRMPNIPLNNISKDLPNIISL